MTLTLDDAVKAAVVFDSDQVTSAWQKSDLSHIQLVSTNKQYRALPSETWQQIFAMHHAIHQPKYTAEFYDCDAFSAVFMGYVAWNFEINGVARVFDNSAGHSYNAVLICDDGKTCSWSKMEPQDDIFVDSPPKGIKIVNVDKDYLATSGFAVTV